MTLNQEELTDTVVSGKSANRFLGDRESSQTGGQDVVLQEHSQMSVIPAPFLFRFTLPVARGDQFPRAKAPLLKLPQGYEVPWPSTLEGGSSPVSLAMAWNPQGLVLEVTVKGKSHRPFADPKSIEGSDAVLIFLDTRDTQSQHRGSKFCHLYAAFPTGGGDNGKQPHVRQFPVPRAREDAPEVDIESLLLESELLKDGYRLAVWIPEEALHGYDPATQKRLGFMLTVNDTELGPQFFTVGAEFPIDADPSLWVSLELVE